ncbi:hypothetical protein ABPG72_014497 [Tetrahymena utriculariae]
MEKQIIWISPLLYLLSKLVLIVPSCNNFVPYQNPSAQSKQRVKQLKPSPKPAQKAYFTAILKEVNNPYEQFLISKCSAVKDFTFFIEFKLHSAQELAQRQVSDVFTEVYCKIIVKIKPPSTTTGTAAVTTKDIRTIIKCNTKSTQTHKYSHQKGRNFFSDCSLQKETILGNLICQFIWVLHIKPTNILSNNCFKILFSAFNFLSFA